MTILSKSLFALVGSHLVAFSFLSAWHNLYLVKGLIKNLSMLIRAIRDKNDLLLNLFHKHLSWLECRDFVLWNDESSVLRNVASSLL